MLLTLEDVNQAVPMRLLWDSAIGQPPRDPFGSPCWIRVLSIYIERNGKV